MQVYALFGERLGDTRTDSLRRAGHQRPLVFEAEIHVVLLKVHISYMAAPLETVQAPLGPCSLLWESGAFVPCLRAEVRAHARTDRQPRCVRRLGGASWPRHTNAPRFMCGFDRSAERPEPDPRAPPGGRAPRLGSR